MYFVSPATFSSTYQFSTTWRTEYTLCREIKYPCRKKSIFACKSSKKLDTKKKKVLISTSDQTFVHEQIQSIRLVVINGSIGNDPRIENGEGGVVFSAESAQLGGAIYVLLGHLPPLLRLLLHHFSIISSRLVASSFLSFFAPR